MLHTLLKRTLERNISNLNSNLSLNPPEREMIKTLAILALSLCLASVALAVKVGQQQTGPQVPKKHLVCYYDSASFVKEGLGKLVIDELEPALQFCDYLIYGYAGLERDSHKAVSLKQQLDLDLGKGLYRTVTRLKRKYPNVKVLLSVGGDKDIETDKDAKELPNKYLELLESSTGRTRFVNTVFSLLKTYGFDGLDVAWQFHKNKPKKVHSGHIPRKYDAMQMRAAPVSVG
ncbi:imaginal disk growth factor 6-like [Drosophila miranda]|uniref:imaginal disk growth factor 6-like n=1 Tax=Drosophila miranda TaxID=7229 RepID=UPI00143F5734|nr:imaginal disk growth factor 6-like [Drosophila miranda]